MGVLLYILKTGYQGQPPKETFPKGSSDDTKVIPTFAHPDGRLIVPMQDGQPQDVKHPHFPFYDES